MLQNAPTLAVVAVDTAKNEPLQLLGVIQFNIQSSPYARPELQRGRGELEAPTGAPLPVVDDNQKVVGALSVVGEVPENFTRLVLLCIEANDCNQFFVRRLPPKSTQCTPLHRASIFFFFLHEVC